MSTTNVDNILENIHMRADRILEHQLGLFYFEGILLLSYRFFVLFLQLVVLRS